MIDVVIPDKISPEIGYRGWSYNTTTHRLHSLTQSEVQWIPGEPMEGSCRNKMRKPVVEVGWKQVVDDGNRYFGGVYIQSADAFASLPDEEPAVGMRWDPVVTERWSHLGPVEGCTCGVYSLSHPDWGRIATYYHQYSHVLVLGSVKLWGKIIPGQLGRKSQYAYPNELWVIANPEALKTLGHRGQLTEEQAHDWASLIAEQYDCYVRVAHINKSGMTHFVQEHGTGRCIPSPSGANEMARPRFA